MKQVNTSDQRYSDVEDAIIGAFERMTRVKAPEKITVTDIIRTAGIVRSTFYDHYQDIPALLESYENRTLNEISKMMTGRNLASGAEVCYEYFYEICEYTRSREYLRRMFRQADATGYIEKALTMIHVYAQHVLLAVDPTEQQEKDTSYAIAYSIGGVVGVLHKWCVLDCRDSSEEIARHLTDLFLHGTQEFIFH
jgi:AcrR family transcriptional regulator